MQGEDDAPIDAFSWGTRTLTFLILHLVLDSRCGLRKFRDYKSMHVPRYLIVLGHYGQMGGAERQAMHFVQYLREQVGADVRTLGWYGDGPLADSLRDWGCETFDFPYTEIAPRLSKGINLLQLAAFIRRRIQPDYILPFVSIHSKPICQIWRLTGAKYAWWNQQDEGRRLYGTEAERRALLNAVDITSNSWAGTEFISETYGIPEDRIITYNNGTVLPDLDRLRPIWRNQLDLDAATPLVSMVANITPYKDHETLLRAWRIVLDAAREQARPRPVLALAGSVADREHVSKLKVLAFDLELAGSVKFLGPIDTTDELMRESDLVVHSSTTEGCPNAICEAMALGKAVVATDIPGTRQALQSTFWQQCLSEAEDAEALARQISYFLDEELQRLQVGAANRERIRREFSVNSMCESLLSLAVQGAVG